MSSGEHGFRETESIQANSDIQKLHLTCSSFVYTNIKKNSRVQSVIEYKACSYTFCAPSEGPII